jgi:hypothetical protein
MQQGLTKNLFVAGSYQVGAAKHEPLEDISNQCVELGLGSDLFFLVTCRFGSQAWRLGMPRVDLC